MKKESGKWKTTLKMAAGSVGFLAGLCVVLILAGRFLCRKSNADIYDTTIEDLLKAQPATLEELTKVKGFPANGKRVAGFGECIVKIFTSTDEVSNITVETSGDSVNVKTELKKLSLF